MELLLLTIIVAFEAYFSISLNNFVFISAFSKTASIIKSTFLQISAKFFVILILDKMLLKSSLNCLFSLNFSRLYLMFSILLFMDSSEISKTLTSYLFIANTCAIPLPWFQIE